jgi:MarR family transcriptional regulator for hemolysin
MDQLRNFGYLVKDTSRLYTLHFERHAVDHGVTLGQCKVLGALRRNEGISQVRLAELTDTDPMTLVRMLDRMETSGLVERRPDPHDRRASRLYIQAGAAPTLDAIARTHDRALGEAMAGLADDERRQLLDLLQKVHVNLDALQADAATRHRKGEDASAPAAAPVSPL